MLKIDWSGKSYNYSNSDLKYLNKVIKTIPLKRLMHADDVLGCVEFLLSPKSKFITGQNFIIDGGQTISR